MSAGLTRRSFLKAGGAAAAALVMPNFIARSGSGIEALAAATPPEFTSWLDILRKQWTWDKTVRGTHMINCWYQAHCAFDVYVKDGLVFREEQAAEYQQLRPELPDLNPRGCQKGCTFSHRMYEPNRILHPMRRVGARGEGKWEQVSWDEALDKIADAWLDVLESESTDQIVWDLGANINVGAANAAQGRLAQLTHSICLDSNSSNGDGHRGAFETFGNIYMERSIEDYFYSDLILIWGANPLYTSIPNAHFFTEARYNGTELIAISPDYSASATKADLWVPVKPGTDAALALAIANHIVERSLVETEFVTEQTDLPLLVRADTGKFLTGADVEDGDENRFYVVSENGELRLAPVNSLALGPLRPRLDVDQTIFLEQGGPVRVRSVFSLLKERLSPYTFEAASEMCGTPVGLISRVAEMVVNAKALSNVTGSSMNKYFHGNLTERAMILIWALLGHMGKPGAGYSAFSFLANDGWEDYVAGLRTRERMSFGSEIGLDLLWSKARGDTDENFFKALGNRSFSNPGRDLPIWTSGSMFWQVHGGVSELSEKASEWVPGLLQSPKAALEEALKNKSLPMQPPAERPPRILFNYCSNPLRSVRGSNKLVENLWQKLTLAVTIDFRMSSTARHADYILPAAAWYEVTDHKWVTPLVPYNHVTNKAVEPLGEARPDFWIFTMLAKHIQKQAQERGMGLVKSHLGKEINLADLYDDMTMDGRFGEDDGEKAAGAILEHSSNLSHVSWEEQKETGFARYSAIGISPLSIGNAGDLKEDEPFIALTHHTDGKQVYPTQTGRIQFYIDHDLYLAHDEHLPRFKAPPKIGGNYPLTMTGGHTRWSVHGVWRDSRAMQSLDRGQPYIVMGVDDAVARGIADGDWVRCFNDVGEFLIRAKVATGVQGGQTIMYHAWENYQFEGGGTPRDVSPSPVNPVELAGDHPHLRVGMLEGQPGFFDRDTRIEIEKAPGRGAPAPADGNGQRT
ncbi:MAG: molybdopterin-dependent oxidoreductase [Hyphomicrobiales bacterium]